MQPDDRIRILHMIEAAEAANSFVAGGERADLDKHWRTGLWPLEAQANIK